MKEQPKKTQQSPISTCHSPSGWLSPLSPYILQMPSLPSNVPSIIFLSLLEHLNFTIIPRNRSFISDLLSLYSTILSLHENIIMDKSCKLEMGLWHTLFFCMTIYDLWLSSRASTDGLVPAKQAWLILRVLYDNHLTQHKDFQLQANTAPLIRFGGIYGSRWFAANWPPELSSLLIPTSSLPYFGGISGPKVLWNFGSLDHSGEMKTQRCWWLKLK